MQRKRALISILLIMALIGFGFVSFPFIASLGVSEKVKNDSIVLITLPIIEEGIVHVIPVNDIPLFILKPNKHQLESINTLHDHVWFKSSTTFNEKLGAYIYWGVSSRRGCPLIHEAPQNSRLLEWKKDAKWLGGFWDPLCEVSYDYAGRSIKTYAFTFNGYSAKFKNLESPSIFYKKGDTYAVSIFNR